MPLYYNIGDYMHKTVCKFVKQGLIIINTYYNRNLDERHPDVKAGWAKQNLKVHDYSVAKLMNEYDTSGTYQELINAIRDTEETLSDILLKESSSKKCIASLSACC